MKIRTNLILAIAAVVVLGGSTSVMAQQPLPAEGDESQLIATLRSDAELFEKAKACQRLAVIGTANAVPALSELLDDEQLSHYARFGLESNPSPDVDAAFRAALGELDGDALVGVINSIGVRRDPQAVTALAKLAASENKTLSGSALASLGAIASADSVNAILSLLSQDGTPKVLVAEACLTAADRLLLAGDNDQAGKIFAALGKADLPPHLNVASRFGQIRAGAEDVQQLMERYLSSDDRNLFRIGLELAHQLPGDDTTSVLLDLMESMSESEQVLLLHVLGSRGDASALPAVLDAATGKNKAKRAAAIEVLGVLGDESVVPAILEATLDSDEVTRAAARQSLVDLRGAEVDQLLLERLSASEGAQRVALVAAVGARGISPAIPKLLQFMRDDDSALREASVEALALTVGAGELPQMVDRLIEADSSESVEPLRDALQKACQRMADRDQASEVIMSRMSGATPSVRAELLDLLIYVGGTKALEAIGTAARSDDSALADAATQALGKWLTPDVAPVLLELAKNGREEYRIRCLRGYIRVIRQFGLKTGQRLQMSKQAFGVATRDEERKLILDTYTRFPAVQSLRAVTPHLSNPSLREDASRAAVMISEKIVNTNPEAVAAVIDKVLAAAGDQDIVSRAKVVAGQAAAQE